MHLVEASGFVAHPTPAPTLFAGYIAPYSATCVERLQAAGADTADVTNMDEFGMGSSTATSPLYGPCINPYTFTTSELTALSKAPTATPEEWDVSQMLTAGGSSGGSAAAVACGAVAAALGSDTGGSVRQPAAFCGIVGFKPSYGAISRWGLIAYASSLDTVGILAHSVDDAALVVDCVRGNDGRDDTCLRSPPVSNWAQHVARCAASDDASYIHASMGAADATPASGAVLSFDTAMGSSRVGGASRSVGDLRGVRVGIPVEYCVEELPGEIKGWWERGAAMLSAAGAVVELVSLPHTRHAIPTYYVIAMAEAASNLARYDGVRYGHRATPSHTVAPAVPAVAAAALHRLYTQTRCEGFGLEVQRRIMLGNHVLSHSSRSQYYDSAVRMRRAICADFHAAFRPLAQGANATPLEAYLREQSAVGSAHAGVGVDVLLTPTSPSLPWQLGAIHSQDPVSMYMNDVMTVPASLARLPAVSIPVGYGTTTARSQTVEVPIGLQLIGRFNDDATLLRVAASLEAAVQFSPWRSRAAVSQRA